MGSFPEANQHIPFGKEAVSRLPAPFQLSKAPPPDSVQPGSRHTCADGCAAMDPVAFFMMWLTFFVPGFGLMPIAYAVICAGSEISWSLLRASQLLSLFGKDAVRRLPAPAQFTNAP